jgi:glycosyltransferase involved in cell wall biosynthesis
MPNRLTVLIPCKNEIKNIRPCIESIREIADEILVADSGSTDGTLEVVRSLGNCRIIEREYIHSGNFKNWAIPQAKHEWILIVDADERVTPELAAEIQQTLAEPQFDGYRILRRNFVFGSEIKHCGWNNDHVLRLFRRDVGRYCDRGVHADVIISSGKVVFLKAKFLHYTYWTIDQYLEKFNRYTRLAAGDASKRGRRVGFFRLLTMAPFKFFHRYVIRLGFLDGTPGLVLCILTAFYSFTKYAKVWSEHNAMPQPDPEAEFAVRNKKVEKSAEISTRKAA